MAADAPFTDGIESIWTNGASATHVSFRIPRADAAVHTANLRLHAEMMVVCGYTEFDSCWDTATGAYCSADVFLSYCDNGGGGGYIPPSGDGSGGGPGGGTGTGSNNRIADPALHDAVDDGKGNATAKLQSAQCQDMIRMNKNAAGISLWNVLTSYSPDPGTYLDTQITFVKGDGTFDIASNLVPCNYDRLAWTSVPGVHTVDVCGSFQNLSTGMRGVTLIHEMLHTLGLPEYPNDPSGYTTQDIQQMVANWCGGQ